MYRIIKASSDPKIKAKITDTENPNDPESSKAVDLDFYSEVGDHIGEASISGVDTNDAFLYNVEVFPDFRGQGFGNSIVKYCIDNYPVAILTVEPSNQRAISLYKKFGFEEDGDWEEDGIQYIVMRRNIDS